MEEVIIATHNPMVQSFDLRPSAQGEVWQWPGLFLDAIRAIAAVIRRNA
jgi:hypothetical protein